MSIAEKVVDCVRAYRKLNIDLTDKFTQDDVEEQTNGAFLAKVNESFERFQLWSSNMGAHRKDRNSLDQRLWEASNLRNQVLQYLEDLQQGFADVSAIINGTTEPWDQFSDSSSDEDDQDDVRTVTELEQLVAYIGNTIDCLLRISLVIQKPAPHDRFIKSGRFDQSFRQPWDVQHVREKFANIPDWLSERLGKANSRRRQFLEYRRAHHERIARVEVVDVTGDTGTVVSSLPTLLRHQELWTSATSEIPEADTQSDTGVSETSYAETIANEHALFVPTMPEAAQRGAVFECPYCFMLVHDIYNRLQWKRHVFADLQPYVCLYQDCLSADETFARRHKWIQHHKHFHLRIWTCNLGCNQTFPSKHDILSHTTEVHSLHDHTDAHLQALSVESQHDPPEPVSCPLCHDTLSSHRKWHKHVAHHLEQLALFVIPRDNLEGKDKEESESDNDQNEKDQRSIASTRRDSDGTASEDLGDHIPDDKDTDIMADVARQSLIYSNSGRYKEAEELQKQVIDSRKHVLGQDHPSTLDAMAELANIYNNQRRHVEAGELLIRVLERRKVVLGEDHLSTMQTTSRLASIYADQKRFKEAEELQKQTAERCVVIWGENNHNTILISASMANIYSSQGRYKEAEEVTKRAGEKYKALLGEDHRSTITNAGNLALIYSHQGRYKEAEELQRQVTERHKAVLGERHPNTLYSMCNLAIVLELQGNIAEAMALMEQVVQWSGRVFGLENIFHTACINTLNTWRAKHAEVI